MRSNALTDMRVGIKNRIDDGIRIEAAFEQRLDHGATPELARLDALEIHHRGDARAERWKQLAIAFDRGKVIGGPIRIDEITRGGILAVSAERSLRRFERDEPIAGERPF